MSERHYDKARYGLSAFGADSKYTALKLTGTMVVQKCSQYIEHRSQSAYFMDQNVVYFCNKKIEYLSLFYATPSVSLRSLSVGGSGYYPSL